MKTSNREAPPSGRVNEAREKTEKVREELELAGAELDLSSTILERELSPAQKRGDVRKAIDRHTAIAGNVAEAAEELQEVEELLAQEICERERLEQELARRA